MAETAWSGDWEKRICERVHSLGCDGITEFLAMFPVETYVEVAKRLGEDVAAVQVMSLQFREAALQGQPIIASKDSLVRVLNEYNRKGWNIGLHWKRRGWPAPENLGWVSEANKRLHS